LAEKTALMNRNLSLRMLNAGLSRLDFSRLALLLLFFRATLPTQV
jgi:hypothetical protein